MTQTQELVSQPKKRLVCINYYSFIDIFTVFIKTIATAQTVAKDLLSCRYSKGVLFLVRKQVAAPHPCFH